MQIFNFIFYPNQQLPEGKMSKHVVFTCICRNIKPNLRNILNKSHADESNCVENEYNFKTRELKTILKTF